jgi:hypothetical protein
VFSLEFVLLLYTLYMYMFILECVLYIYIYKHTNTHTHTHTLECVLLQYIKVWTSAVCLSVCLSICCLSVCLSIYLLSVCSWLYHYSEKPAIFLIMQTSMSFPFFFFFQARIAEAVPSFGQARHCQIVNPKP